MAEARGGEARAACPTLAAPMPTGDGWLVRFVPPEGLSRAQAAGLARAAARLGNGLDRGDGAREPAGARAAAGDGGGARGRGARRSGSRCRRGRRCWSGALAGLDRGGARRSAAAGGGPARVRRPLLPKVAVVVDGGGALHLDAVAADVRLRAMPDGWLVSVGGTAAAGRAVGLFDAERAVAAGLSVLWALSARGVRGRDLELPAAEVAGAAARAGACRPLRADGRGGARDRAAVRAGGERRCWRRWRRRRRRRCCGRRRGGASWCRGVRGGRPAVARGGGAAGVRDRRGRSAAGGRRPAPGRRPARRGGWRRGRSRRGWRGAGLLPAGVRLHLSGCAKRCAQPAGRR